MYPQTHVDMLTVTNNSHTVATSYHLSVVRWATESAVEIGPGGNNGSKKVRPS